MNSSKACCSAALLGMNSWRSNGLSVPNKRSMRPFFHGEQSLGFAVPGNRKTQVPQHRPAVALEQGLQTHLVQAVEGGGDLATTRVAHQHFEAQDFLHYPIGLAAGEMRNIRHACERRLTGKAARLRYDGLPCTPSPTKFLLPFAAEF